MFRELVSAKERYREDVNRDITHAWYVAALSRAKKLPKLSALLVKHEAQKRQTPQQMRSVLEMLGYKSVPMSEAAKKATHFPMFRATS